MTGRPTIRTEAMIRELLERLSEGESLRSICSDDHMPARQTIMIWVGDDVNFSNQYARAREDGLDNRADKIEQDIDSEPDVARARLKLDFAKWYLSKLAPKRYGDKIAHVGGSEEDPPISVVRRVIVDSRTEESE